MLTLLHLLADVPARPEPSLPAATSGATSKSPYVLVMLEEDTSDGEDIGVSHQLLRGRTSIEAPRGKSFEACDTSLEHGSVTSGREHEEEEGDNEEGEVYVYDSDEHDDEGLFVFADTATEEHTTIVSDDEEGVTTGQHVDEQHLRKRRKVSTGQDGSFEMEGGRRVAADTASRSNAPSALTRRPDSPILLRTVPDPRAKSTPDQATPTLRGVDMRSSDPCLQSGSTTVPSHPRQHTGSTVPSTSRPSSRPDPRDSLLSSTRASPLEGSDTVSAIPLARVASTGALDSSSSTPLLRPPTAAKASYQRRTTSTPASMDKPTVAPAALLSVKPPHVALRS